MQDIIIGESAAIEGADAAVDPAIFAGPRMPAQTTVAPPEKLPFNWGGFGLPPLWLMSHGQWGWGLGFMAMNVVLNIVARLTGPVGGVFAGGDALALAPAAGAP